MGPIMGWTLGLWGAAWGWCYPAARGEIASAVEQGRSSVRRAVGTAVTLPATARAAGGARGRAREALVWANIAGPLVAASAVAASLLVTGNFLFESADVPGGPEHMSGYFQTAAGAILVTLAIDVAGLIVLGVRRANA